MAFYTDRPTCFFFVLVWLVLFYCSDFIRFMRKIVFVFQIFWLGFEFLFWLWYVLVFCANFRCLVWCWVWWLFFASFLFCRAGLLWTLGEGISVKVLSQHFPLQIFLPIWEDENCGPGRENFLPGFPSSPFSLLCQTVENTVFHPIFLPMFSILSIFTPTKHSVRLYVVRVGWNKSVYTKLKKRERR